MKKYIFRICSLCLVASMLFLTGCAGSFFEEEEGLAIVDVQPIPTENGTKMLILYNDESFDEFFIPNGERGEAGVGIENVSCFVDESDRSTQISISFTSKEIAPLLFSIPHGISVSNIENGYDEEKQSPYIQIIYTNETKSDKFYLPKGEKGNDGNGIKSYSYIENSDKSLNIEFVFDDGSVLEIPIPPPNDGVGIDAIETREEGELLFFDITYTDGTTVPVSFNRSHRWHKGGYDPNEQKNEDGSTIGFDGDYFFDTAHKEIFVKEGGIWNSIISFTDETTTHTISFDLNDNNDARMPSGSQSAYRVLRGSYFSDQANGSNSIPVPTRNGFIFKGWCTKSTFDPTTMSLFTDLTPVFGDLTLFAIWEPEV